MSRRTVRIVLVFIALAVTGCDQGSKRWAEKGLDGEAPITLVERRADLTYTENPGNAFRMDRVLPAPVRAPILWSAALATLGLLGLAWWRQRRLTATGVAGALIAAGAAGNLIDRVARGFVVDFIHVHGWPVFNVADVALAIGGGLLVLAAIRAPRPAHPGAPPR
jgi:signal peptidase II